MIPAIAVPVAIVGTFFFLNLFGFTINLLTLFALVLAIGIVVDDAIVVVEAVHAKLDMAINRPEKLPLMPWAISRRDCFHYAGNVGSVFTGNIYYRLNRGIL